MNEKLTNILIETLEKAQSVGGEIYDASKEGLSKAVEFAQEQIPDVIAQILKWELAYHSIAAVAYFIGFTIFGVAGWRLYRIGKKEDWVNDWSIFGTCIFIGMSIGFFGFVPMHAMTATKIAVAPKVFFIDYCADLIAEQRKAQVTNRFGDTSDYKRKHNH